MFMRSLLIVMICLGMVACASTKVPPLALELGRSDFQAGYYASAFRTLLPLAREGNAEAEYAIGYMYYYGYGISPSETDGLDWMTRAADQNYEPAVKALEMIHRHNSLNMISHEQANVSSTMSTTVHTAPPSKANPSKWTVHAEAIPHSHSHSPHLQPHYVLQLFGAYDFDTARQMKQKLHLSSADIWHTKHLGRNWYVLTTGHFDTAAAAFQAKNTLNSSAKSMNPWVRPAVGLEAV